MNWKHAFKFGVLFVSVMVFAAISAQAQPDWHGRRGPANAQDRIDWRVGFLSERLNLTDDQSESVKGILEKGHGEAEAWRADHPDASRDDMRAFRDEHRAAIDAAVMKVLNDEQQSTYKQLQEQRETRRAGMKEGMRRGMRDGMGMGMHPGMGPGMHHGAGPGMKGEMGYGMGHHGDRAHRHGKRGWGMRHGSMGFDAPDGFAGPLLRGLIRKLDLTDAQRGRLTALKDARRDAVKEWSDAHPEATWQERLAFRRDQVDASIVAITNILTPEQNQKLNELAAQRPSDRFGFDRGRRHEMFMQQLNLTKEQQDQMEKLREEHRAAAEAWHKANPNATREERRAFREAHQKGMEAALKQILTKDQLEKLKSLHAGRDWGRGFGPPWGSSDDSGDESGE